MDNACQRKLSYRDDRYHHECCDQRREYRYDRNKLEREDKLGHLARKPDDEGCGPPEAFRGYVVHG